MAKCNFDGVEHKLCGADADRIVGLLSAVYGRPVDAAVLKQVARAAARWRAGEHALAQFELAFARLPPLQSDVDAFRLFVADAIVGDGMAPRALLQALGFAGAFAKYDSNQPRVPAGNGRASGQFGSAAGAVAAEALVPVPAVAGARGLSFLDAVSPGVLANLTVFALRFSTPTAVLGALFIPTPNSGGVTDGVLPDAPGVRFRRDGPSGTLRLTAKGADDTDIVVGAQSRRGVYVDVATGKPIGRDLGERLYLDADAVDDALYAALAETEPGVLFRPRDDDPRICPATVPDVEHRAKEHILDYEDDVHRRVNPSNPLPRGFAVSGVDPLTGRVQFPDDCFEEGGDHVDGDMKRGDFAEGKAGEFERMLNDPKIGHLVLEKLVNTGKKYVRSIAPRDARLKFYFAEAGAADFVRNAFAEVPELKETVTVGVLKPSRRKR